MKTFWAVLSGLFLLLAALPATSLAQMQLTPAQAAILKRDVQKAQDHYVRQVAKVAGVREVQVRQALPDRARITDPASRVIAALEHQQGRALSEEQKVSIRAAETEFSAAVQDAEKNAHRK